MLNTNNKNFKKGFTLIEVLLIIVLITVLLTIGLTSINIEARFVENRNDTRKTHIKTIEGAIAQYRLQEGSYPSGLDRTYREICDPDASVCVNFVDLKAVLVPKYLQAIPQDPNDTDNTGGTGYSIAVDEATNTVSVRALQAEGGVIINTNDPLPAEPTTVSNTPLAATVPVTPQPPPPPWTPTQISTALWLDADDASTITLNGSTVSQWRDKSGNGRHANQATAVRQPGYNPTTLNSKPGVTFDGTLKHLDSVAISNIILNNSYSAFTVGRATSAPTNNIQGFFNSGFWGDNGGFISNYFRGTSNLIGAYNWDINDDVTTQSYTFGTNVISGVELSGGSIRLRQNGGTETSTASGNATNTNGVLRIGKVYRDLDPNFTGVVSEVIFCRGHLSTTDRQLVEGYLAHKWGLAANLSNDHPYKNAAPTL